MTEFLSHPIPAVVILLGLLVFVHEFGHFVVGRACGIAVEIFSIGFGPPIVRFRWRGTDYRISWIPLGGYVKFAGAHPAEEVPPGLHGVGFLKVSLPKRAATILAGPLANFLLAIVVYTVLGMDGIAHPPPMIGEVIEGSRAEAAGILPGDKFVSIDGTPIVTWRDLEAIIATSPGKTLAVTVERQGQRHELKLTPAEVDTTDFTGRQVRIGRAGIALGSLPPIVSVISATSPAAQAGLVTGDRIDQVTVGSVTHEVKSFPDLLKALSAAATNGEGAKVATLKVETAPLAGEVVKPETAGKNSRSLFLDLSAVQAQPPPDGPKGVLKALGLTDAQLTVGEATETVATVLKQGDRVQAWNGAPLRDVYALREHLIANDKPEVTLSILRDYATQDLKVQLKGLDVQKPEGLATVYMLPISFWGQPVDPEFVIEKYTNPLDALGYGTKETWRQTLELVGNVKSLFSGEIPLKALGGPMLIAKVAGDSARRGWQTFLNSMALISVNLGLLNLFPIPVLDGGQLLLMGAEAVRRRPLREVAIENFQKVGFVMVMALVVLATYNDLSRFWKSMLESVVGLFQ